MSTYRTPQQKANDARDAYLILREEVTLPEMRSVLGAMTSQQTAAAAVGDIQAYAALVQAALKLQSIIAANDRVVMVAAAILTSSGVTRPSIETGENE